jgi:uncharacterized MnhB-related membrane protein
MIGKFSIAVTIAALLSALSAADLALARPAIGMFVSVLVSAWSVHGFDGRISVP